MRKKYKIKPSLQNRENICYGLLDDNCWGCKNKHACGNCYRAKEKDKRRKIIEEF